MGTFLDIFNKKQQPAPATTEQPAPVQQPVIDTSNALGSLTDLLGPTPAEREAQERRMFDHKNKMQTWFGLFDGLRQLGNLYATAKGASPMNLTSTAPVIDQQYQQNRQFYNDMTNYRRNYAQQLYNLHRQQQADKRTDEEHQAKLDWYKNRDEQNAEKLAIQKFNSEVNAAYKNGTLEEKKRMNDIMAEVYSGRISLMEAQEQLAKVRAAHVGAGGTGRSNGTYGYRTTKHVDPATGDVITERVPTTGSQPQKPQSNSGGSLLPGKKQQQKRKGSLLP